MLTVFMFFSVVFMVLMGCLVYIAEQGTFTVNAQYPNGAYLKMNDDENGQKVSNIFSAVQGIYWATGTATGNSTFFSPLHCFPVHFCYAPLTVDALRLLPLFSGR
jgi:hypothetical protein